MCISAVCSLGRKELPGYKSHPLTAPLHYYKEASERLGEASNVLTTEASFHNKKLHDLY
jgi:hypothetical protein